MKKFEKILLNFYHKRIRLFFAIIWFNTLGEILTFPYQIRLFKKIKNKDEKEEKRRGIIKEFSSALFFVSLFMSILFWIISLIIPMWIFIILTICSAFIFICIRAGGLMEELLA